MRKFEFDTVGNFDNHIRDSIHGYDLLDNLIINMCSFFAKQNEIIVDLGCSSGRLINKLASNYSENRCIGYDIVDSNFIFSDEAELRNQDITEKDFEIPKSNIILSIFTLQFISYYDRFILLKKIFKSLNKNGVFIICEKEISQVGIYQEVFTFANYDYKKENFTNDQILEKERGLRSVMNCLSFGENETLLKNSGFTRVEQFFQSLNFKGWICML